MSDLAEQLSFHGLEATRQRIRESVSGKEQRRALQRLDTMHDLMSSLPEPDELSFLHSGMCQTCLPHHRPEKNSTVWTRSSGRFTLMIAPGVINPDPVRSPRLFRQPNDDSESRYVGVPYGSKARLILIHLQTEGVKSRFVSLGPSLSAFLRSLGLPINGGAKGSIRMVREQCLRIARCTFTMQWTGEDGTGTRSRIEDTKIAKGLDLWHSAMGEEWAATIELTEDFYEHLKLHAVPLDKRGIAHLSGNSLGLDLYTLFAYRLPKLSRDTHIRWGALQAQIGASYDRPRKLAEIVRKTLPDVITAYPHARVEVTSTGLTLKPSQPAVPRPIVQGFRLIESA
jgi:hypothetical protein